MKRGGGRRESGSRRAGPETGPEARESTDNDRADRSAERNDIDKEEHVRYVDGFVMPIKKKDLPAYRRLARLGCEIWKEYGALDYQECVGEDLAVKFGLPFPKLLKLKPGETVVFSWIVYKSRAQRDRINAKVMKDPRMMPDKKPMPFDVKRMANGGFEVLVSL
jgi:uncharacterized protein YbaA (DUF1428 family)